MGHENRTSGYESSPFLSEAMNAETEGHSTRSASSPFADETLLVDANGTGVIEARETNEFDDELEVLDKEGLESDEVFAVEISEDESGFEPDSTELESTDVGEDFLDFPDGESDETIAVDDWGEDLDQQEVDTISTFSDGEMGSWSEPDDAQDAETLDDHPQPVTIQEQEFTPGSVAEKVQWYQAILRYALGFDDVPLNGKHNDPPTRARLKQVQRQWGLMDDQGYLTVESNAALTHRALNWIYRRESADSSVKARWNADLKDQLKKFQGDEDLEDDGKLGPDTRITMVQVLKRLYEQRQIDERKKGRRKKDDEDDKKTKKRDADDKRKRDGKRKSHGGGKRTDHKVRPHVSRKVSDTIAKPYRWMCYLDVKMPQPLGEKQGDFPGHGSGVLISPWHILTCAHNVLYLNDDKTERFKVRSILVYPGYNNSPRHERYFNKKPFGAFEVDIQRSFVPKQHRDAWEKKQYLSDWDFAVLRLSKPVDQFVLPKKLAFRKGSNPYPKPVRLGNWLSQGNLISAVTSDAPGGRKRDLEGNGPGKWDALAGKPVFTVGYPKDESMIAGEGSAMPKNCIDSGTIFVGPRFERINSSLRTFRHNLKSRKGSSGGPVWKVSGNNGVMQRKLVGIHILGDVHCGGINGHHPYAAQGGAVAITPEVIRLICDYDKETFAPIFSEEENGRKPKIVGMRLKKGGG